MNAKLRPTALLASLAVAGLVGCQSSPGRPPQRDAPDRPTTFTRDVAPIVFHTCAPCHRPGGAAPFGVLTYSEVRQHRRAIVAATGRRFMPPWLPEPGYGDFAGGRRLTDAQIETIRRWVEDGAVEGDAADLPPLPHFAEGWRLGTPDLVVTLPQPYTVPAASAELWRNFVVPIPVSTTRYVKTVEIQPGNARIVHHALMGIDPTRSSRRRDQQDKEEGFAGMDMADSHAPDGHLLGWTPGMTPFPGIEGQAWRLDPGTDLVLQLHVIPSGKPEVLNPTVGLYFAGRPRDGASPYLMRLDADHAIDIPPGDKQFVVADTFVLPVDVDVLAVYPHAHFLARTVQGIATLPDGTEKWLIRIRDWDFKWQDIYRYRTPVPLPSGTAIRMQFSYDNSSENVRNPSQPPRRVVAGPRSSDEMAHLQLQVLPRRTSDAVLLREALNRHTLGKNPDDAWAYYELGNALRDQGRLQEAIHEYRAALLREPRHTAARNNLGAVLAEQGNHDEAISQYHQTLRIEPDFPEAHYNLGNALRFTGRLDEAMRRYREALRLEPALAEAHNNLGEVLASQRRFAEAIEQFRSAVRLKPDSAEAHNNLGAGLAVNGNIDEAIVHLREALRIEPDHARARDNLAIALETAASGGRQKR